MNEGIIANEMMLESTQGNSVMKWEKLYIDTNSIKNSKKSKKLTFQAYDFKTRYYEGGFVLVALKPSIQTLIKYLLKTQGSTTPNSIMANIFQELEINKQGVFYAGVIHCGIK